MQLWLFLLNISGLTLRKRLRCAACFTVERTPPPASSYCHTFSSVLRENDTNSNSLATTGFHHMFLRSRCLTGRSLCQRALTTFFRRCTGSDMLNTGPLCWGCLKATGKCISDGESLSTHSENVEVAKCVWNDRLGATTKKGYWTRANVVGIGAGWGRILVSVNRSI